MKIKKFSGYAILPFKVLFQIGEYCYRVVRFGFAKANPNTREFWDKKFESKPKFWRNVHYTHLKDMLPKRESFSLLDVGCGSGDGLDFLAKEFPNATLAGLDISEVALERAKEKLPYSKFYNLDVLKSDLPDKYDYILLIQTLEHFANPHELVDKCLRYCKKSLIIITPYDSLFEGKFDFLSEHRYSFNENTFKNYNSKVAKLTEYIQETKSRCIYYEILP